MVALNDEGTEDVPDLTESSDEDSTTALTDLVSHLSILHPQDEVPQDEVTRFQLLDGHHRLEAAVILHERVVVNVQLLDGHHRLEAAVILHPHCHHHHHHHTIITTITTL
jgi:hypothetical protein